MTRRVLDRLKEKVRNREYIVTLHAEEEMSDDGLTISDLENIILAGRLEERQLDRVTGERKNVIVGPTCEGQQAAVVLKLGVSGFAVIITVYRF